jgi:hypothetical protein
VIKSHLAIPGKRKGQCFFLCLLFRICLQLKIIVMLGCYILGKPTLNPFKVKF